MRPLTLRQVDTMAPWAKRSASGYGESHPADARAYVVENYKRYQRIAVG